MKRFLSILMIIMIISMIVMVPINDNEVKAESIDYGYLLTQFSPIFWTWWTQAIGSMGLGISELGNQLDYINRNGEIDQYFEDVYDRFVTDVQSNWGYATGYVNFTAQLWKDLFAGDPLSHIIGTQEMYEGSTDEQSPYYIDPSTLDVNYGDLKVNKLDLYDHKGWKDALSRADRLELLEEFGHHSITFGVTMYYTEFSNYNYYMYVKKVIDQTITTLRTDGSAQQRTNYGWGLIPVLSYINSDGSNDQYGNKYKLSLLNEWVYYLVTLHADGQLTYCTEFVIDSSVSDTEYQTLTPVDFNAEILENTITDEDIYDGDYILYEINRSYLEQIQDLITKISMAEDTPADWVLNPSSEVVRVETTNTIIREIIQAGDATLPIELDFPELQDLELPSILLTKFPFCIPWDVYNIFAMLNKTPVEPRFEIPFVIENIVDYDFVIEFDQFESLFVIVRWFILALYCLGLIIMTRNMIKG